MIINDTGVPVCLDFTMGGDEGGVNQVLLSPVGGGEECQIINNTAATAVFSARPIIPVSACQF